jgi:hypothetical protein
MPVSRGTPRVRIFSVAVVLLLLPLVCAAVATPAGALPHPVVWQAGYSFDDRADGFLDIAAGSSGAVYCAGFTKGTEERSTLLLVKYVDNGLTVDQAWARTFSLAGHAGSRADDVEVDRSGNVIVAGTVGIAPPASARGRDIVVLKYSAAGVLKWRSVYNGSAHKDDVVSGLGVDARGNAYVTGTSVGAHSGRDYVTIKVRKSGPRAWVRRYVGPSGRDEAAGIVVDSAGNSYVTGTSKAGAHERAVTIKYDATGRWRWRSTSVNDVAGVFARAIDFSGTSVIVGGATWNGNAEGSDALFLKYRKSNGTRVWKHTMGNGEAFDESIADLDATAEALVGAGATHDENFGATHGYMAGLSAAGADGWTSEFWVDLDSNDAGFQAVSLNAAGDSCSGGWAQTVVAGNDFAVRYVSHLGPASSWDKVMGGTAIGDDVCRDVLLRPAGVYAAGELHNAGGGTDAVLLKL